MGWAAGRLLDEFLRCFFGCLAREHLQDLSREIDEISSILAATFSSSSA